MQQPGQLSLTVPSGSAPHRKLSQACRPRGCFQALKRAETLAPCRKQDPSLYVIPGGLSTKTITCIVVMRGALRPSCAKACPHHTRSKTLGTSIDLSLSFLSLTMGGKSTPACSQGRNPTGT